MSQSAGRATWGVLAFIAIASTVLSLNPVRQVTGAVDGLGDTACLNVTTNGTFPLPPGTPCDDGFNCTYDEQCALEWGTDKIRCRGLLNNTYCDAGDACTSSQCQPPYVYTGGYGASGCTPPTPYADCSALNTTCASFACDPSGTEGNCANATAQNEGDPCEDVGLVKCTEQSPASCVNGNCTTAPDADGDTICDSDDERPNEFDPTGYFYDQDGSTGLIVPGGHVAVTCQPGSATFSQPLDGSTGQYMFVLTNITTEETCTLTITPPPGCALSRTCLPEVTPLDPTGSPNPLVLGNYPDPGDPSRLTSAACTPWYTVIELEDGDPAVINNNIPLRCPDVKAPTVSTWGLGALAALLMAVAFGLLRRNAPQT